MNVFFRFTHNPDGSYRDDAMRKAPDYNEVPDERGFIVHLMDNTTGQSFNELVNAVQRYEKEWHHAKLLTDGEIALALVRLLEDDAARVESK